MCRDIPVGTDTSYHIILLRRYSPVYSTGMMPKDTFNKAMTGHIILLRRCVPVCTTRIITKGMCNKDVTGQMT